MERRIPTLDEFINESMSADENPMMCYVGKPKPNSYLVKFIKDEQTDKECIVYNIKDPKNLTWYYFAPYVMCDQGPQYLNIGGAVQLYDVQTGKVLDKKIYHVQDVIKQEDIKEWSAKNYDNKLKIVRAANI